MPRTRDQIEQAAVDAAAWLDSLDVDAVDAVDAAELRLVAAALADLAESERRLSDAVRSARAAGHSWSAIGGVIGVSKQSAAARYGP